MINKRDIHSITDVGTLNGAPVKMIRTKGGYHIFLGKNKPGRGEEILTASSHRAIGLHTIEQQFVNFQPALLKSENEDGEQVLNVTDKLGNIALSLGYKVHVLTKNNNIRISISKNDYERGTVSLSKKENVLTISDIKLSVDNDKLLKQELSQSLVNIVEELSKNESK